MKLELKEDFKEINEFQKNYFLFDCLLMINKKINSIAVRGKRATSLSHSAKLTSGSTPRWKNDSTFWKCKKQNKWRKRTKETSVMLELLRFCSTIIGYACLSQGWRNWYARAESEELRIFKQLLFCFWSNFFQFYVKLSHKTLHNYFNVKFSELWKGIFS